MVLFVCMIIIGAMVFLGNKQPTTSEPRSLVQMQMYTDAATNSMKDDAAEINSIQQWSQKP